MKNNNRRSHIGRDVQKTISSVNGLTYHAMARFLALARLLSDEVAQKAVRVIADRDLRRLLEIARVSPADALAIIEDPEITDKSYAVEYVYEKLEERIQAAKRRRVSADDRIQRAWPGYWRRWLAKFDTADHDKVRDECSDLILMELAQSRRQKRLASGDAAEQKDEAGAKKIGEISPIC
jgi:hypothetical protein